MQETMDNSPITPFSSLRHSALNKLAILAGALSLALGAVVLVGWYSHNVTLIQINAAFVPMQYNTALGFLLSGIALLLLTIGRDQIAGIPGLAVLLIGGITLIEYIGGVNLYLDQLFMEHYVTVKTSHPGRMAPNTAFCFFLTGLTALFQALRSGKSNVPAVIGVLGAFIFDLGIKAFTSREHECLKFALEQGVDAVSQSFVESAKDIEDVRCAAKDLRELGIIRRAFWRRPTGS